MDTGKLIKDLRGKQTQEEFSKAMGISRNYLSELENNKRNPSVETLEKIAKALDKKLKIEFI